MMPAIRPKDRHKEEVAKGTKFDYKFSVTIFIYLLSKYLIKI